MNCPTVHRFFQDNAQKYGAAGMYAVRLLHMRIAVLCAPELVQAVVARGRSQPKAHAVYDSVDELFSPDGHRSFFTTHDDEEWRMVRRRGCCLQRPCPPLALPCTVRHACLPAALPSPSHAMPPAGPACCRSARALPPPSA